MTILSIEGEHEREKKRIDKVNNIVEKRNTNKFFKKETELKKVKLTQEQNRILDEVLKGIAIPNNYELLFSREGIQNGESILLYRFVKEKNYHFWEEHFSIVVSKDSKKLLGLTWMDQKFQKKNNNLNISKSDVEKYALAFISKVESNLVGKIDNLWIDSHDEVIKVDGNDLTITGMKYKCYIPDEDTYVWVIVSNEGEIITYERGIIWNNTMNRRHSEMWLHDSWLVTQ